MAKFKFELSPEQLAEVTKQAKEKLLDKLEKDKLDAKTKYEIGLANLQSIYNFDIAKLLTKYKYGYVEEPENIKTTGKRHTWTDAEIETLVKLWSEGKRAKAISLELGINAGGVNAKATALSKLGKLK